MSTKKADRAATLLESGMQRIQAGQFVEAQQLCEQALQLAPRHPDALHLLGIIALQQANHAAAVEWLQQAVAIRPDDPAYHCNLAYGYVGLKRLPEALEEFEHAARIDAADPDVQLGIGNCLAMMGKAAEAEAVFRRLVARHPEHPLAWFNLANAVRDQERYEEARDLYRRATQLAPPFAEAHCNLGVALQKLDRFEEAEQAFRVCLGLKPDFVGAYVSLAITLNCLRRHTEAEALCRKALARDPGQKNAWPVRARALTFQHRWSEAVQCYERAVTEFPESSEAFGALGNALARTGRMREAMEAFDRAMALGNVSVHTRFAKAVALFSAGRMAEGAAEYAGRHERSAFIENHPERPLAAGLPRDLHGQVVCLHGEQGLADEIFFLRFAPQLKARGCRVIYHGNPNLIPLLARCGALDRVLPNAEPFAAANHILFVGDLLAHFLGGLERSPFRPRTVSRRHRAAATALNAVFPQHSRLYWPELPPPLKLSPLPERVASVRARLRLLGPPPYVGLTWRAGTGPQQ
jgi:tetratricopeptide (TPR) repeat protein